MILGLVLVGKMQGTGTMASVASLFNLAGVGVVGSLEKPRSQFRGVCLSRRGFKGSNSRWYYVSFPLCKYSATTTTDFVADQGNAISVDSNSYSRSKEDDNTDFLLKPAPKPVLKAPESKPLVGLNKATWESPRTNGDSNSNSKLLDDEGERSKMIESLGEVLEKAEKLETPKLGNKRPGRVVDRSTTSNSSSDTRPTNSMANRKAKTLKSVWRKGDTVASVQKDVAEPISKLNDDVEVKLGGASKIEPQSRAAFRPPQPPVKPQPKLQAKPMAAPRPALKKPVVLKDVGAATVAADEETNTAEKTKERKPILIDKYASKKSAVDPFISEAVLAPTKPGKAPPPGKFKDDYRKKNVASGGPRRRMVNKNDGEIPDDDSIPRVTTARKGRKWTKASRKAVRIQASKDAAPVKVEILEVEESGMLLEELAYNLAINEGEILGYLYAKGIKPDGVQTLDKEIVKMICREYGVETIDVDPVKVEDLAKKRDIFDEEDLDKLQSRPPVITIMGHVDHGKVI